MHNYEQDQYLAHFGIKGMKWGVRRYQNKDGTYTAAGVKDINRISTSDLRKVKVEMV